MRARPLPPMLPNQIWAPRGRPSWGRGQARGGRSWFLVVAQSSSLPLAERSWNTRRETCISATGTRSVHLNRAPLVHGRTTRGFNPRSGPNDQPCTPMMEPEVSDLGLRSSTPGVTGLLLRSSRAVGLLFWDATGDGLNMLNACMHRCWLTHFRAQKSLSPGRHEQRGNRQIEEEQK